MLMSYRKNHYMMISKPMLGLLSPSAHKRCFCVLRNEFISDLNSSS